MSNGGWSDPRDHLLCQSFPFDTQKSINVDLGMDCFQLGSKTFCSRK